MQCTVRAHRIATQQYENFLQFFFVRGLPTTIKNKSRSAFLFQSITHLKKSFQHMSYGFFFNRYHVGRGKTKVLGR